MRTVGFNGDEGEASGVVIDRAGVIVTNFHVVRGARTLTVSFGDGRHKKPVRATVIGTAENRDLAIIHVKLSDLVPIALGRSAGLRLGDSVLTVGFPLNLGGGPTVTQGIVSGLNRTVTAQTGPELHGMLQTDAAINPGNSGGALIDATGKLIGINTVAEKGAENVGFARSRFSAVPMTVARTGSGGGRRRTRAGAGTAHDVEVRDDHAGPVDHDPRGHALVSVEPTVRTFTTDGSTFATTSATLGGVAADAGPGSRPSESRKPQTSAARLTGAAGPRPATPHRHPARTARPARRG